MDFDFEGETASVYQEAGADIEDPPHIIDVARRIFGSDAVHIDSHSSRIPAGLPAVFADDTLEIFVRPQFNWYYTGFLTAHELGEYRLWCINYLGADVEKVANRMASHLMLPRPAFRKAFRAYGGNLQALARRFGVSETMVAVRAGEVFFRPVVVLTKERIVASRYWVWNPPLAVINELVVCDDRSIRRRGLKRVQLRDNPSRFALFDACHV